MGNEKSGAERMRETLDRGFNTFAEMTGRPVCGEILIDLDGNRKRIARERNGGDRFQPSTGAFFLSEDGEASLSVGSLGDLMDESQIEVTGERKPADFWLFKDMEAGAGRGVTVSIPVRVWRQVK